ncbi:MAG: glucose 1-dehydrogenase [Desulfarculus sp.]|jgi:NAD(P)-dependent dehydrogenase (short-subunit alcohol dehydrogenase family)|nr:MAG: glucose 1-dehydrogenase [Desulfarculus sp.]
MRLKDKVAIVTGSGQGIGEAIALEFARQGAKVAVMGRRQGALDQVAAKIKAAGGTGLALAGDVRQPADIDRVVSDTVKAYGKLDILVNVAGILISTDVPGHTEKIWDDTMDTNVKGTFLMIQRALPEMLKQGRGKIINIASIAGEIGFPNAAAYCASKAAIQGLTKALAMELAPKGINVNCIGPGDVETPLNRHLLQDPVYLKSRIDQTPAGRVGQPKDIAPGAVYLASDEAEWVHGITLFIDGGLIIN